MQCISGECLNLGIETEMFTYGRNVVVAVLLALMGPVVGNRSVLAGRYRFVVVMYR